MLSNLLLPLIALVLGVALLLEGDNVFTTSSS